MFTNWTHQMLGDRSYAQVILLLVTSLVLFIGVSLTRSRERLSRSGIFDANGEPIFELTKDARVDKFIYPSALSQQGRDHAGDKPFLIRNGKRRELVITRPDHIRDFYRGDTSAHPKPVNLNMGQYFGQILGDAVGAKDGERWKVVRKYFDPFFSFQASRQVLQSLHTGVAEWCEELPRHTVAPSHSHEKFHCDIKKLCRFLPFRLMAAYLYGEVFDSKAYSELLDLNVLHEVILHDVILSTKLASKWGWLDTAARRRAQEYNRRWETFNMHMIHRARVANLGSPAEQIYHGTESTPAMKKTEFLHTMDEILFANIDVSAAVLHTMLQRLASNTSIQEALRHEIRSQALDSEDGAVIDYIAGQSSLLHRVVMESMRFSPAFAFSLPECTAVPKVIGGFRVPAHTSVIIDAGRLNSDTKTWGPSADEFQPQRFETISPLKCRYEMMRFGVGANSGRCLGKHFADAIFKLAAVCMVQQYEIRPGESDGMAGQEQLELVRLARIGRCRL
ncbi:cytochrome P450 [Sphaerulina musiva SO2202]|uniref:Cytochrome P450 n=1 Tax=Sphaerulina musiva (strain SO2202) TaxID=692275 RepID=N1QFU7_SPHMS|nr:cytochrome P450 [Sphaerulina musiva SO2202]EMF12188.1 cytochrome P450 [Sphaerulina musiva SO2202]